ncbi:hypothetical protein R8Z57_12105 [Microbacterium sp. M3]|uniref:Uncharacterized protein n=1 Tax=Microbacterium arthrosphaerae TaxID=792652 RepID=A0ABU4H463_9MICO|nr:MULTISPECIES: hypothetical protein [Microbacterium]MDW4573517.1 hypothetical protein [Microbacterium arthrosphaerae]MDW7607372.1 hypothetical protein [Microbacterium sp. M3]
MPREVIVVSRRPLDMNDRTVVHPAVAKGLHARAREHGAVTQWCRADGTAVLTMLGARGMDYPVLAAAQLGFEPAEDELFWCEGVVPFGPDAALGIEVLRGMAANVGGRVVVGGTDV